ncbi:hypothetical protein [Gordonia sp. i37]|nr:hypothetical protein [Gordonia sp. i37]
MATYTVLTTAVVAQEPSDEECSGDRDEDDEEGRNADTAAHTATP